MDDVFTPPDLDLEWRAVYNDGTELTQNSGKDDEHHLGHVQHDKLVKFYLEGKRGSFCIDLQTGEFNLNGIVARFRLLDVPNEGLVRQLIYFRRIKRDFQIGGGVTNTVVRFALGWEATVDGRVEKRIVMIEPDNSFTLLTRK